jgi:hypothetical protein
MYYKKLQFNNFYEIQNKIVSYVAKFVTEDVNVSEEKLFFNFISNENLIKFKRDIPELFECIQKKLGSEIILMSYIYVDGVVDVPVHTDSDNLLERRTRLNWPILNGPSAATVFFEKNHENIPSQFAVYKSGVSGRGYDIRDCYEVDRYILDTPTLMNVKQLHSVEILDSKLPRILLTMRLSNEEEVYQKYFLNNMEHEAYFFEDNPHRVRS